MKIVRADYILSEPVDGLLLADAAVAVDGGRILAVSRADDVQAQYPEAELIDLGAALLMPGLVNAHQHGRGLSQLQIGYRDMPLEPWLLQRRGRGVFDPYPLARLTAANMLANGVTTALQANFAFGSGDYAQELRAQLRGYEDAGLRVTMSVGAMDRGFVVYPPHEACFMAGLPPDLQDWLGASSARLYAGDGAATVALMRRLRSEYAEHPRIRFCYGPAGPQWVSDDLWREIARDARAHDLGINMHALESPTQRRIAEEIFPDGVLAHLDALGAVTERTVVAHGVWPSDADIEVLARRGATVVTNPGCNLRLSSGIAPIARYLAGDVRLAIGTDNHGLQDDEDLLAELRLAGCLARTPDGAAPFPPGVNQLLAMATVNGAVAAQWGGEIGRIAPGLRADLAAFSLARVREPFLDADMPLLDAFLGRAQGRDVVLTMVEGEVLYRDGAFSDPELYAAAEAAAAATARSACGPLGSVDRTRAGRLLDHVCDHYRRL